MVRTVAPLQRSIEISVMQRREIENHINSSVIRSRGGVVDMLALAHCRSEAARYAVLAQGAKSRVDENRYLRMKRSYELMARSAEFDAALRDLLQQLKRK
jgi:hypothetical protein